jgi:CRISPR-associated protein Csx3
MINFKLKHAEHYTLIEFELEDTPILPEALGKMCPPNLVKDGLASKGVILSGKGPIWLYAFLAHYYHPTAWVATFDPRYMGGVVVQSHKVNLKPGDIIPVL